MRTTATAEDIADTREIVEHWATEANNARYQLSYAGSSEDAEIDRLTFKLVDALKYHRWWSAILADMEAGAGDFCPPDEQ